MIKLPFFSFLAILLSLSLSACAQLQPKVIQHTEARSGRIAISETVSIPAEDAGYTLVLPPSEKPKGLIVFFRSDRDTTMKIIHPATEKGLGVLFVSSGNWLEFLFDQKVYKQLDGYIQKAIKQAGCPPGNLLFAGMSLQGTRALKMAGYYANSASGNIYPRAIALCDAPLDFVRFHKSCRRAHEINFQETSSAEGAWVTAYLEKSLDGDPSTNLQAYLDFSPYSYVKDNSSFLTPLKATSIRAYTEPDVKWWMETRRIDYYGMNAIDAAALINELHILEHPNAELIVTTDKGVKEDGSRHPHSWSIVDEEELLDWFVKLLGS